jgi:replicative superfamily II helicase
MVKLLIIDEVHLLNDERGAVIETIVARTLRQVIHLFLNSAIRLNVCRWSPVSQLSE